MTKPLITVIIPTRERYDTLRWALKTCLDQKADNLRILVSDNFSQDETGRELSRIPDSRLRYINTGERLAMSQNWEFALGHVEEGYVMFLGDDDGLMPDAIEKITAVLMENQPEVFTWKYNTYYWPEFGLEAHRNKLTVTYREGLEWKSSHDVLKEVLNFRAHWDKLPFLYNMGVVHTRVIERVKEKSGKFFLSRIPDVFSGILLGTVTEKFLYSNRPYALAGISRHSTGLSQSGKLKKQEGESPAEKFAKEENLPYHPKLVYLHTTGILIGEAYFQVREIFPEISQVEDLKIETIIRQSLNEARVNNEEMEMMVKGILVEIAERNHLPEIIPVIKNWKIKPVIFKEPPVNWGFFITANGCILNAADYGVRNIYEASLLADMAEKFEKNGMVSYGQKLANLIRTVYKHLYKRLVL